VKHQLSILVLFAVSLTAVAVSAGEEEDKEAIRALFQKEQDGHRQGDAKMVRSTYWDDFYIIETPRKNNVPRYMLSGIFLREQYFGNMGLDKDDYEGIQPGDDNGFHSEFNHVSVNGDVALAVTQFHYWGPTPDGRRMDGGHQTMWVAERRNGIWKWKSATMGFEGWREYSPALPTSDKSE
jgi:ketosteroid isomerase-like protein